MGRLQVPAPSSGDEEYPYLSIWGRLAFLASIQAAALHQKGSEQEAFDLAIKLVELGDCVEDSGGTTIHYLRGASIKTMGLSRIRQMTCTTHLPGDRLVALSKRLDGCRANVKALTNTFKVDYQLNVKLIEDLGVGKFPGTNGVNPLIHTFGMPMLSVAKTKLLYCQTARVGLISTPRYYADMPLRKLPREPTNTGVKATMTKLMRRNVAGEFLHEMQFSLTERLLTRKCEENVAVSATQLALALKSYQAQHGTLPESLNDLVPDYLATVPRDDFDGKPFRYSRTKSVLYSVGWNLTDDGGQDRNAQKERLDLLFNLGF